MTWRRHRRHWFAAAAVATAAIGGGVVATRHHAAPACDQTLWKHIYHPARLVKQPQGCITVTGTIAVIRKEADGDYHVLLKLDPQFASLVNAKNISAQHGDLVFEPICENNVTQSDATAACSGFTQTLQVPPVGTHVRVTGEYVLDSDHGWMELHPVTRLVAA